MKPTLLIICILIAFFTLLSAGNASENIVLEEVHSFTSKDYLPSYPYKVCMEGHVYYKYCGHNCSYTPKVDDNGKPVKCKGLKRTCLKAGTLTCTKWGWVE
jgi:hypothetical protein